MVKLRTIFIAVIIFIIIVFAVIINFTNIFKNTSVNNSDFTMVKPIIINNSLDITSEKESEVKLISYIPLAQSEILLGILSYDLNFDDSEEQIHIIRKQNDPTGHLILLIAMYNRKTKSWFRLAECETLVTQLKTLNLRFQSITNDPIMSLICEGLNEKNESTLTIYRIVPQNDTLTNNSLILAFSDYGDSVQLDNTNDSLSYVISVSRLIPENPDSIIEEIWKWDNIHNRYVKNKETIINKDKIINSKIEKLLSSSINEITQFINGIWYKTSEIKPLYIDFQFKENKIVFSLVDYSEIYSIDSITQTSRGLYISCINQSITSLKRYITIEIKSESSIELRIFQNLGVKGESAIDWNGVYTKYYSAVKTQSVFEQPSKEIVSSFNGTYLNDSGIQLILNSPEYQLTQATSISEHGYFYILIYNNKYILDCVPTLGAQRKAYIINKRIQNKLDSKHTSIELIPIKITLSGPVETGENVIELVKQ